MRGGVAPVEKDLKDKASEDKLFSERGEDEDFEGSGKAEVAVLKIVLF
jgi:hypothetical protein